MRTLCHIAVLALASTCACAPAASAGVDLVGNPAGDQLLVHRVLGQHNRPLYAATRAPGGPFGTLRPLTGPVDPFEQATVIDDSGGAAAAWVTNDGAPEQPTGKVMVAIRAPGGDFAPPVQLASDASFLRIFGNGRGDMLVSWYAHEGGAQYSVRPAAGQFGPAQALPAPLVGASIDGDGTVLGVFSQFEGDYPSTYRLLESKRPPEGDFGTLTQIPGARNTFDAHLGAAEDGRALLAWGTGHSRMAADRLPGGDFGTPVEVGKLEADGSPIADVKLSSSGAAAISVGLTGDRIAVRAPGGSFAPSTQVAAGRYGEVSKLAVNARGDVVSAWHGNSGGVFASYREAGSPRWSKRLTIARASGVVPPVFTPPGVALDDSGKATFAWEQSDGATVRTYTRTLRGAALGAARVVDSIPTYFAEGPPSACRPKGAPVLLTSGIDTVFVRADHGFSTVFGCLRRRGAPVVLVDRAAGFAVHTMSLAGPLVAYGSDDLLEKIGTNTNVNVIDLRDPEFGINRSTLMERNVDTAVLLATRLRPNGAVAWLSCPDESEERLLAKPCRRVGGIKKHLYVWPSRAEQAKLVGNSRWIDRRTLRLRGSLLTWRDRGTLHRTRLR